MSNVPSPEHEVFDREKMDLSLFVRQTVKAQNSVNGSKIPSNGGLRHGFASAAVHTDELHLKDLEAADRFSWDAIALATIGLCRSLLDSCDGRKITSLHRSMEEH
jgi:hypothetical protein